MQIKQNKLPYNVQLNCIVDTNGGIQKVRV